MDEPCDLLKSPWYVVGSPWGDGDFIRAEAPDAAGTYVCGIESAVWDPGDQLQHYSDVLSYICQIHNARLTEQPQQLALADARAETAELELAHLRSAYDTLFETHQREMDRLYSLLGAARAFRAAVQAVDGIVDAEAALLAAVDQLAPHACSSEASLETR